MDDDVVMGAARLLRWLLLLATVVLSVMVVALERYAWGPIGIVPATILIVLAVTAGVIIGRREHGPVLPMGLAIVPPAPVNVRLIVGGETFPLELAYAGADDEGLDEWVATTVPTEIDLTRSIQIKADNVPEHTWIRVGHVRFHV